MKKLILRLFVFTILGVAGYFAYQYYSFEDQEVWQLIPEDAFAIIEVDDASVEWADIEKSALGKLTNKLDFSESTSKELERINSILKPEGYSVQELLANKKLTFSMHQKLDGSYATLIYLPVLREDLTLLNTINKDYKSNSEACKTIRFEDKWYMGYSQGDYTVYAYNYNSIIIFSSSQEVIKKAIIRTTKLDNKAELLENKRFHEEFEADNSKITLYLKMGVFFKGLKPYFKEETHALLEALSRFEDNAFLDVSLDESSLELSGFSHSTDDQMSYLSSFEEQKADRLFLQNYIPLRSVLVNFWHLNKGSEFELNLTNYWENVNSEMTNDRKELSSNFDIQIAQLNQHIKGQVAYALLSNNVADLDKILLVQIDNMEEVQALLNEFAYKMSSSDVVKKTYHGDEIVRLELFDFPAIMLGEYYTGFDNSYFCVKDGFLMVSNEEESLQAYLDDLAGGRVWNRSLQRTVFVDERMVSSNFGYFADLPKLKAFFKKNLSDKGREYYKEYEYQINQLEDVLVQISADSPGKFYTDVVVEFGVGDVQNEDEDIIQEVVTNTEYKELFSIGMDTSILTKPVLVKNYKTKTLDILIQTSDYKLHNVSQKGEVLWSRQLDTIMLPEAFEMDFYTNGKLQYLFATKKSVYLLDRLGNPVEGFPFGLPDGNDIETVSLFDYDNNRKYRILASDGSGLLFLFNKEGKSLGGWSPLEVGSSLVQAARHLRVRGKDFILAVEEEGKVNLFNRRGEKAAGFPIDLGEKVVGQVHVDLGKSLSTSFIKVLSQSGKITSINLMGASSEDEFWMEGEKPSLIVESGGDDFVLRNEAGGKDLFFKSDRHDLHDRDVQGQNAQFYTFNGERMLVFSGGKESKLEMIVNQSNVAPEGLLSDYEVGVLYSKRKNIFQVYMVHGKQLQLVQFDGIR